MLCACFQKISLTVIYMHIYIFLFEPANFTLASFSVFFGVFGFRFFGISSMFLVSLPPAQCIWMELLLQCTMPLDFGAHRLPLTKSFFILCATVCCVIKMQRKRNVLDFACPNSNLNRGTAC